MPRYRVKAFETVMRKVIDKTVEADCEDDAMNQVSEGVKGASDLEWDAEEIKEGEK